MRHHNKIIRSSLKSLRYRSSFRTLNIVFAFVLNSVLAPPIEAQNFHHSDDVYANSFQYEDSDGELVLKTWYHYVVSRKGIKYIVRTFFPETKVLTAYWTYADRDLKILDGPFKQQSDDGKAITEGNYLNNELHDNWQTSTNGQVLLAGRYDNGLRVGEWKEWYPNGQVKSSFTFDGGEELGPYVMYDTTGVVIDKGNSILGERYTTLPPAEFEARRGRSIIDEFPCFGTCDESLTIAERARLSGIEVSHYIEDSLKVPEVVKTYGISGRVNASVLIDHTGNIADVTIVNGLCQPIAEACIRILNEMPKWTPAKKDGNPTEVRILIPFAFAME